MPEMIIPHASVQVVSAEKTDVADVSVPVMSSTSRFRKTKVPAPDQALRVFVTVDLTKISSAPSVHCAVLLEFKVMLPALDTSPPKVKSPVPVLEKIPVEFTVSPPVVKLYVAP